MTQTLLCMFTQSMLSSVLLYLNTMNSVLLNELVQEHYHNVNLDAWTFCGFKKNDGLGTSISNVIKSWYVHCMLGKIW